MSTDQTGFGVVPRHLRGTLTALEIALYVALSWRADQDGHSYASQPTIAKEAGMSRSSVQRALKGLEDKGLVLVTPWDKPDDKGQASNVYTLRIFGSEPPTMGTPPARPGRVATKRKRSDLGGHKTTPPTMGTPPAQGDAPPPLLTEAPPASHRSTNDTQLNVTQSSSSSPPRAGMPRQDLSWYPKAETIAVAKEAYPWATDVAMKMVTMSLIAWCATKKRKEDDSLWLAFMKREDADRAKAAREEQTPAPARKWFDVAD